MNRTFVRVELVAPETDSFPGFWEALLKQGFKRTVAGKKTGKAFRLPKGFYLVENATPEEALVLTKAAVAESKVEARIFCVPVGAGVRFANLQEDDEADEDEMLEA